MCCPSLDVGLVVTQQKKLIKCQKLCKGFILSRSTTTSHRSTGAGAGETKQGARLKPGSGGFLKYLIFMNNNAAKGATPHLQLIFW